LWALAIRTPSEVARKMIDKGLFYTVRLLRLALVAFFIGFLVHHFFNIYTGIIVTAIFILLMVIFSKKIQVLYGRLEQRFIANLNEREIETSRLNRTELAPWDAHIVPLTVPPAAACIGKTLQELKWRESIGINVVMIKRGDWHIAAPDRDEMIFPNDELLVLGTDHQVQRLRVLIRPEDETVKKDIVEVALYNYYIDERNLLNGKTIRQSGLREKANALVVGIERNDERILNPESDTLLQANDYLFIVANPKKIKEHMVQFEKEKI
jgi:CPA2 family monovalent cation:H+ antiporter-2